jgi:hypothetical protein
MKDRLKVLDANRKAILALPSGALHLWLCYWMAEDEEQESWLSIPELEAQTGLTRPTIVRWTTFLVKHKWLVDTGKVAADKWVAMGRTPTPGAYQVHVYRVDDPTSQKSELVEKSNETEKSRFQAPVKTFNQLKDLTQGSVGLGSGSGLGFSFGVDSSISSINPPQKADPDPTPRPDPKPKPTPMSLVVPAKYEGKECWTHHLPLPCPTCRDRSLVATQPKEVNMDDLVDKDDPDFAPAQYVEPQVGTQLPNKEAKTKNQPQDADPVGIVCKSCGKQERVAADFVWSKLCIKCYTIGWQEGTLPPGRRSYPSPYPR